MSKKLLFILAVLVTAMMCAQGASAQEAYACADYDYTSNYATLTFYYDNDRSSRLGATFELNAGEYFPGWVTSGFSSYVKYVVFDPSFAAVHPSSTYGWFLGMTNLVSITGLSYLNTSEVTNMVWMFSGCNSLTSLDLSSFNTSKVTRMDGMFQDCDSLTSLDLSSFDTSQVTNMEYMFSYCRSLTSVDLSSFNTSQVTNMEHMFNNCFSLRVIYVGSGWTTASVIDSSGMFSYCTSLVGGQGTTYDASHVDSEYAHIDGGPNNPGYFTDKNTYLPGDVNGDLEVNIADVNAVINMILGGNGDTTAADVNGDGEINIADINAIIAIILGGTQN
ncbi:MAG: BspA family leucine-rich repeat surface protein [Muribaculaceae bacterium]|nr:BspA family leucine-rich repeat surface protein [Muribaculaceae bacterium]